jgi:hypothetical protein
MDMRTHFCCGCVAAMATFTGLAAHQESRHGVPAGRVQRSSAARGSGSTQIKRGVEHLAQCSEHGLIVADE